MDEYKVSELKKYIEKSELIIINERLRIRLSNELLKKYNDGLYVNGISQILECIKKIDSLGIKYPASANPIFYIYIVPDEEFRELLNFPASIKRNGGGKPVLSYDLDGFNEAYGISSSLLENIKELDIMNFVNDIHELAHLVHSMFFNKSRLLTEGFAEALPLYTLDYENLFDEHREMLKFLGEDQILSANQLLELANKSNFDAGAIIKNRSCSFDLSYVSAYLFVRGCMEIIENKFEFDKVQATQKFLEIVKQSNCNNQWLVYDIAEAIGIEKEELLDGKKMQLNVIKGL